MPDDKELDVLKINLAMVLPEGFRGGYREAVGLFLDLREGPSAIIDPRMVSPRINHESFYHNQRFGAKAVCQDGIWSVRNGVWVNIAKPPKDAKFEGSVWAK